MLTISPQSAQAVAGAGKAAAGAAGADVVALGEAGAAPPGWAAERAFCGERNCTAAIAQTAVTATAAVATRGWILRAGEDDAGPKALPVAVLEELEVSVIT